MISYETPIPDDPELLKRYLALGWYLDHRFILISTGMECRRLGRGRCIDVFPNLSPISINEGAPLC
jgi:hypothetical protein